MAKNVIIRERVKHDSAERRAYFQSRTDLNNTKRTLAKEKHSLFLADRKKQSTIKAFRLGGSILSIILPFFLAVLIFGNFTNDEYVFSFEGILNQLASLPTFPVDIFNEVLSSFTITADWGAFNGFRDFLNLFGNMLGFLSFIGLMIYNALAYVLAFIRLLFGF